MRILFVHPAPRIWTRAALIPLGLAYIAAFLEKNGFTDISVVDYNINPRRPLPKADVVGITATTPLIKSAWKVAKKAKRRGAVTIVGGPHVSALPEETITLPWVDFVCVGEGEETMLELCRALRDGKKDFRNIKGLVYKKGKKVIFNPPRPFITDLDSLPFPAYHLFDLKSYTSTQPLISTRKPAVGMLTSRGCPFGCKFCYKGTFGRVWRPRSVENVVSEWEYLVKQLKVHEIALLDDGFNIDIPRAEKICREIVQKGIAVPWRAHNGIRADRAPVKLLRLMQQSGCYMISFGVESGVQRVLNLMGKNLRISAVRKAFRDCRKLGILTMGFFMIGFPGETKEDIKRTINFALKLDPDFAQFSVSTPFPGTGIYNSVKITGRVILNDWDRYSQFDQKGYYDFGSLSARDVAQLSRLAYRRFYLRPHQFFRLARRKETWFNMVNIFAGAAHYLWQKDIYRAK